MSPRSSSLAERLLERVVSPLVAELLTVREVAERSKLGEKAVRKAIERGDLPASKLCGRWRILPADYDGWVTRARFVPRFPAAEASVPLPPPVQGSRAALRQIESEAA